MNYVKHVFYSGSGIARMARDQHWAVTEKELQAYMAKGTNCAVCGLSKEDCNTANEIRRPAPSIYE